MEKLKINLVEDSQGEETKPIIQAHSLNMNFQHSMNNGNSLDDGNITISGKRTLVLANGQSVETNLKDFSIRLKETETMLSGMTAGPEKTALQAKFNVWSTYLTSVQNALAVAMKAQYLLDNPVTEGV